MRAALAPIAEALLASAHGAAWRAARAEEQWTVGWGTRGTDGSAAPVEAALVPSSTTSVLTAWSRAQQEEEARAARERPRDPQAMWSGTWWSAPPTLLTSRGSVRAALDLVEDDAGLESATVVPLRGSGRTLEITSAHDWVALCRAFPLEVTASRRHDWFRVTEHDGRWLIPDWQRVALEWDAVHLTTFAYLSAATTLFEIDDEYASVIGGWGPDATLWLTDTVHETDEPRQQWARHPGSGEWARAR